jgi:hypothetical protein
MIMGIIINNDRFKTGKEFAPSSVAVLHHQGDDES